MVYVKLVDIFWKKDSYQKLYVLNINKKVDKKLK